MARKRTLGGARSFNTFGLFRDHETDWLFKRTLAYMNNRCAETGECLEAARHIDETDAESWIRVWADLAARVEAQGDESLSGGHRQSARDSFLRAMNYYRSAEYACTPTHPRFHELWRKSVACMGKAAPLFPSSLIKVEVPFEKYLLPGYFWRPAEDGILRPTLILAGGTDSSLEEMMMSAGPAVVERGYNLFSFDYPGHRGAVHLYPDCVRRPDYEVPFARAMDFLQGLPGTDSRIALAGFSFGGYVAARVAVHEKRLSAVIPDSPIIDVPEIGAAIFRTPAAKLPRSVLEAFIQRRLKKSPITRNFLQYTAWLRG
ncbi:MAG: alpha/beta fold hydrolase, partial [Spirochaetales bacterium]|nr:alpha/beta fold hydrolase [Spirochaetales bacterium]